MKASRSKRNSHSFSLGEFANGKSSEAFAYALSAVADEQRLTSDDDDVTCM